MSERLEYEGDEPEVSHRVEVFELSQMWLRDFLVQTGQDEWLEKLEEVWKFEELEDLDERERIITNRYLVMSDLVYQDPWIESDAIRDYVEPEGGEVTKIILVDDSEAVTPYREYIAVFGSSRLTSSWTEMGVFMEGEVMIQSDFFSDGVVMIEVESNKDGVSGVFVYDHLVDMELHPLERHKLARIELDGMSVNADEAEMIAYSWRVVDGKRKFVSDYGDKFYQRGRIVSERSEKGVELTETETWLRTRGDWYQASQTLEGVVGKGKQKRNWMVSREFVGDAMEVSFEKVTKWGGLREEDVLELSTSIDVVDMFPFSGKRSLGKDRGEGISLPLRVKMSFDDKSITKVEAQFTDVTARWLEGIEIIDGEKIKAQMLIGVLCSSLYKFDYEDKSLFVGFAGDRSVVIYGELPIIQMTLHDGGSYTGSTMSDKGNNLWGTDSPSFLN